MDPFRQLGEDRYTCVAPPGFDVDPSVVAAIREFDQGAIPIWRIQLWAVPWSFRPLVTVHHGIGRHYPIPRYMRRHFHVEMPADADFPAPNFLDVIFEDADSLTYRMGGPGGYIPWHWNVYYWCRWQFDRVTLAKWQAAVDRRQANMARWREQWEADLEYSKRQIEPWILRKLEGVTDADWAEYMKIAWGRPGVDKPHGFTLRKKKPFVDLGRSPRPTVRTYGRVAPV